MSVPFKLSFPSAVDALQYIEEGASLEKALAYAASAKEPELRAAVQSILYNAIRRLFLCEALVKELANREPNDIIRRLLIIALSQLIESPEKSYAIVNETVLLLKSSKRFYTAAGFVNACLRRFGREKDTLLRKLTVYPEIRFNAPLWYIDKLYNDIGEENAKSLFTLAQKRPSLVLRVNRRKSTPLDWCKLAETAGLHATPIGLDGVILSDAVPVDNIPGFSNGLVSVQDAGAQLAAQFLAPQPGEQILDACAAPGGKTAHLLECSDAKLIALEQDPLRATRIEENLHRLGLNATVLVADAADTKSWNKSQRFDAILLDAPCTASGILRRHPDIVLNRREEDINSLYLQQKRLLEALWPHLKFGGRLLYVVCSVFREEGKKQIDDFLKRHKEAHATPLAQNMPATLTLIPCENEEQHFSILPQTHDGFFYAMLTKK